MYIICSRSPVLINMVDTDQEMVREKLVDFILS